MTSSGLTPNTTTLHRHSLYTPELQLLAETALSSSPTLNIAYEYLWFAGQPVAQIETATNTVHYYFNDHLGTPILTTNATATVDWRIEREPYGQAYAIRTGADRHQPLSFPGQEEDGEGEGERNYNIFRWYRAGWGRYTQADPIRTGLFLQMDGSMPMYVQRASVSRTIRRSASGLVLVRRRLADRPHRPARADAGLRSTPD